MSEDNEIKTETAISDKKKYSCMEDEKIISAVRNGDLSALDFILGKYKPQGR